MKYTIFKILSVIFVLLLCISISIAQAQSPQDILTQYIADLQKNPNDYALREKIIKYVQTVKPAPDVPTEVMKHEGAAEYAFKNAKNESDYLDSAKEYEKALLVAPWIATDYFNCAVAYEKAGQFKNAIIQFNFYLLAAPEAQDANAVRKRIGGLEYAAAKAAKEPPQTAAAPKPNTLEDLLRKIDGRRYTYRDSFERITQVLDVNGKVLVQGSITDPDSPVLGPRGYTEYRRYEIRGRVIEGPVIYTSAQSKSTQLIFTISEDGEKIHLEFRLGVGKGREYGYYWQR